MYKIRLLPLTFIIAVAIFSSCSNDTPIKNFDEAEKILNNERPMYTFRNIGTLYTEETKKVMKVNAPLQYRYENGDERFPNGIDLERYDKKEGVMTTLVADSAYYNFEQDIYKVMGHVVVVNLEKKQKLETELLNWDRNKEEIYTDKDVKITDEYQVINGKGMRANQDFSEYSLTEVTGSAAVGRN